MVRTAMTTNTTLVWDVTLRNLVNVYRRFVGNVDRGILSRARGKVVCIEGEVSPRWEPRAIQQEERGQLKE
jgi:hypothetical protein